MRRTATTSSHPGRARNTVLVGIVAVVVAAASLAAIAWAIWWGARGRDAQLTYDLAGLRKTDPNLIVCEELPAGFKTGFQRSRAIATDANGAVYVSGDRAVRRFDAAGRHLGETKLDAEPGCLAVDRDGTLYVALGGKVAVHASDGRLKATWPAVQPRSVITGIAVTDRNVFLADAGGRVVRRYDKSGRLLNEIGRKDAGRRVPGLIVPSPYLDLAMAPDGLLRVANPGRHQIEAYTVDGDLEFSWGRSSSGPRGFCGCCNPSNFALIPSEKGFGSFGGFVTCEKGLTRVKLYDAEGRFVGVVAGPESFRRHDELAAGKPAGAPYAALDVAVDTAGRIFVLDPYLNQVRVFRRKRGPASAPGAETIL
ncbi:MAG: NHL repeat-containing protein [Phycisphaerae bacterium]